MECTKTAVAQHFKAIKKALTVSGHNEADVLRARLLHLQLNTFQQKWILPLLLNAAEDRHQDIASSYDAQEVMDTVSQFFLSKAAGEELKNLVKEVIGPDGTVLMPENWNRMMKMVVGRLIIGQSMRAGNLAGVERQDFSDITVEQVGDSVEVFVPLKHHKVSKFKKAFLQITLDDFQDFIMPVVQAARKREELFPAKEFVNHVFVTADLIPIRKSEFFLSEVNKGRAKKISTNIIRHCSTKLVMTGKNPNMTIDEHARVLLHNVATAKKIYYDVSRKESGADVIKYRSSLNKE